MIPMFAASGCHLLRLAISAATQPINELADDDLVALPFDLAGIIQISSNVQGMMALLFHY